MFTKTQSVRLYMTRSGTKGRVRYDSAYVRNPEWVHPGRQKEMSDCQGLEVRRRGGASGCCVCL